MLDTDYDGAAVLLAGTVRRAHQIKRERADQLPDIADARDWTPSMPGKDGLRIGRIYLAQGDGFSLHAETGRRVLATALRCALRTPGWDRQVWDLTADGEVRPLPLKSHVASGAR